MPDYRAPIRDMEFVSKELLGLDHYQGLTGCEELGEDLWDVCV